MKCLIDVSFKSFKNIKYILKILNLYNIISKKIYIYARLMYGKYMILYKFIITINAIIRTNYNQYLYNKIIYKTSIIVMNFINFN